MNYDDNARALADELAMFAAQFREAVDGEGDPPHPWRLDDWLACYQRAFDAPPNHQASTMREDALLAPPPGPIRRGG